MRLFTLLVSAVLATSGIWMIFSRNSSGWFIAAFFGLCFLAAIFAPSLPKSHVSSSYQLLITNDEIACEHPKRKRESIHWKDVSRIWNVTTSDGPWLPDSWIVLEGENEGCSLPTDARDFNAIWNELKHRFPDFDYEPLIRGGTDDARHLCWERRGLTVD